MKFLKIIFLLLLPFFTIGQEICDNGFDDDGDGMIDLNDTECTCFELQFQSLYEDFETYSCCPELYTTLGGGGMYCLDSGWEIASNGTSDYFNTCDYIGGDVIPFVPLPVPSGEGAVGAITQNGYAEYFGICLPGSLVGGVNYDFSFYVGFNDGNGYQSISPFNVCIFGTNSCDYFPSTGTGCMSNDGNWIELTSVIATGTNGEWTLVSGSFIPPNDMEAIAIGACCNMIGTGQLYHFYDDITFEGVLGTQTLIIDDEIIESGDCIEGYNLFINEYPGTTYQWFLEGVAIDGAIDYNYDIPPGQEGNYQVMVIQGEDCAILDPYYLLMEFQVLTFDAAIQDILCKGVDDGSISLNLPLNNDPFEILWENGETTQTINELAPGNYQVTLTDANGCFGIMDFDITEPATVLNGGIGNIIHPTINQIFGSATAVGLDGTPPYTYLWSSGETTETAYFLVPGVNTITITDSNGCTKVLEIIINEILDVQVIIDDESCAGCDGVIILNISGGLQDYNVVWETGFFTPTITNLCEGFYPYEITDASGTVLSGSVEILDYPTMYFESKNIVDKLCFGDSNGSIALNVGGGVPDYTYNWNNGATSDFLFNLEAGEYSVTVSDLNGCEITELFVISELQELDIVPVVIQPDCTDGSLGSIKLQISGGEPSYSVLWNTGETADTLGNLASGNYFATITDSNGCIDSTSVVIESVSSLYLMAEVIEETCLEAGNGSIELNILSSNGSVDYLWADGTTTNKIENLTSGNYEVTISDESGCISVYSYTLNEGISLMVEDSIVNPTCFNLQDGSINIFPINGISPFEYLWNTSIDTNEVVNIGDGEYFVTVTDANDCANEFVFLVSQPDSISLQSIVQENNCKEDSIASIELLVTGGTAGYSYQWSNTAIDSNQISDLPIGIYTVNVLDGNNCSIKDTFEITFISEILLEADITNAGCSGEPIGSINITPSNGIEEYLFNWYDGQTNSTINNLGPGIYTIEVIDALGCIAIDSFEINPSGNLDVDISNLDILCYGNNTGEINININDGLAPFQYFLNSDLVDISDFQNLIAGVYEVEIVDANNCMFSEQIYIYEPDLLTFFSEVIDVECFSDSSGMISIDIVGGAMPYQIEWSNGVLDMIELTNLPSGNYLVTITDKNGCILNNNFEILENDLIEISIESIIQPNDQSPFGEATISVLGGLSPYMITWDNGETGLTASMLDPGLHSVEVVDKNGCVQVLFVTITGAVLDANYTITNNLCFGECNGVIEIEIINSSGDVSILWSDGSMELVRDDLCNGFYSFELKDDSGNEMLFKDLEISSPEFFMTYGDSYDLTCINSNDGAIYTAVSGGVEPYVLQWEDGQSLVIRHDLPAGDYYLTITDANDCEITDLYTISEPDSVDVIASILNHPNCNSIGQLIIENYSDVQVPLLLNGVEAIVSNNGIISNLQEGNYTLSYQLTPDCIIDVLNFEMIEALFITGNIDIEPVVLNAGEAFKIDITSLNIFGNYSIEWASNNALECELEDDQGNCLIQNLTALNDDRIIVTIISDLGCEKIYVIDIIVLKKDKVAIPNIFNPTNNQKFNISLEDKHISIIKFNIYDRWGSLIYTVENILPQNHVGWDGKYNGKLVEQGVYIYHIITEDNSGVKQNYFGDITVIF